VSGTLTVLSTHNSFTARQVPYLAPVTVTGSYAHQFPFGLSTRVTLRFVGERQVGLSDDQRLNSYSLIDASADFAVTKNFGIFLHLNNILDEQYSVWNLYQEMPFSLLGGVSVKW
jgi:outer membrane receptor protein involved in Fe transport